MMKKLYLLSTIVFFTVISFGQTLLTEDFSEGNVPPSGWSIDAHSGNWSANDGNNAGAQAPEAKMHWDPEFNGTSRLISPEVDASGMENLKLMFRHMIDFYSGSFSIGVETRSGGGDWNETWSQTITSGVDAEQISVDIDTEDAGAEDFQFCIYFSGNSYNLNDWYIDNIELFNALNLDLKMEEITLPDFVSQGENEVTGVVTNVGVEEINSFDMHYSVDEGPVYTSSVENAGLESLEQMDIAFDDLWEAEPGAAEITVWVSNVNGQEDDNPDNNELSKAISVALQDVQRRPLYEEFTSSTCGPCATFNNNTFNPFIEENGDDIALIKYQMDWPGAGDPYYTEEGGERRMYYGVNAVPSLFTDGSNTGTNSTAVNNAFDNSMETPAFMDITGNFQVEEPVISGVANVESYIDAENLTLHIVIIEKETTGNVGSNGETEFHHVMMKMFPDAGGTTVDLTAGETLSIPFEEDLSGTNVEEFDDLSVVIFVQDDSNQDVMQSAYAQEGAAAPLSEVNILDGATDIPTDQTLIITFSEPVRQLDDTELTDDNVDDHVIFNQTDENGSAVDFDATINEEKTEITVIPDSLLDTETQYYLAMEATVENYDDIPIEPWDITFETEIGVAIENISLQNLKVFPNPVRQMATIQFELRKTDEVQMAIMNTAGQIIHSENQSEAQGIQEFQWDASNAEKGLYICTIKTSHGTTAVKLTVN
ncbi:MAG: T9SS type A sorting domain-containing protein [Bacteroidota bacterium]